MKKILLAGLVAASTVFAQGAMADNVMGKLTGLLSLSPHSLGISGLLVRFDMADPNFSASSGYASNCDGGIFGIGASLFINSTASQVNADMLMEALENNYDVNVLYEVTPSPIDPSQNVCQVIGVSIEK